MQMKVESRLSDKGFDKMLLNTKAILPPDNKYPGSYKDVKKILKNMGLGYETIHALYYKEFKDHTICPRMYMSPHISGQMRWHAERDVNDPDYIRHLADGEAWKKFDSDYPEFASEIRNVRLGLATDGLIHLELRVCLTAHGL
ncbi:unnamed protein product [Rhodiola kirilowii]